ncbi:unnamed protein product [Darwinula stevensoni]|uniref:Factor VIII intron 22 protein n=1 Tax=Darwinula stevensoni TaxID=69355 RepID=A0A7R8X9H9_9CRUS|nr:unnamed protein product [Darwinula stevensoni]CAG0889696.1 unnamed protein product [Darwinula stevensoni]
MEETASKVPLASGEDFLNSYQTIASKLKRKFLRKPNVSDAEEEFNSLARQLEQQEQHSHAAVCHLAAARCEGTLGNPFGEAESLIKGARAFLAAEQENRKLSLPAQEEHLMAAMSVFNHAIKVYLEQKQKLLASRFCLELANALKEFGKLREALAYYQKSIEMEDNQTLGQLNSQELVASCFIEMCDYHAALSTFDGMRGTLDVMKENGVHEAPISGLLRKCEVMQVLLLLLLQIPPAQMKKEYSLLLSKYTFEDEPLGEHMIPVNDSESWVGQK